MDHYPVMDHLPCDGPFTLLLSVSTCSLLTYDAGQMTLRLLGKEGVEGWSGLVKVVKAICKKGKIVKVGTGEAPERCDLWGLGGTRLCDLWGLGRHPAVTCDLILPRRPFPGALGLKIAENS